VLKRMMKCGKAYCACATDPAKRHGPYYELTYKANGKKLLSRLERLSQTILRYQAKQPPSTVRA
jgi:hypothetical protein